MSFKGTSIIYTLVCFRSGAVNCRILELFMTKNIFSAQRISYLSLNVSEYLFKASDCDSRSLDVFRFGLNIIPIYFTCDFYIFSISFDFVAFVSFRFQLEVLSKSFSTCGIEIGAKLRLACI